MQTLVDGYKKIFLGKRDKPGNSSKTFSLYWIYLLIQFEVFQSPKSNLMSDWILLQGFIMPSLDDKHKIF